MGHSVTIAIIFNRGYRLGNHYGNNKGEKMRQNFNSAKSYESLGTRAASGAKKILKISLEDSQGVISLSKIKPTQITVGLRQVETKQKRLRKLARQPERLVTFLLERPIPLVKGPEGKPYAIDHHHLGYALVREKFKTAPMVWVADYSSLSESAFWKKMQEMQYVHPRDEQGRQKSFKEIPGRLSELRDDPYRSLAGFARRSGAFEKVQIPFTEFKWADYFRKHISRKCVKQNFGKALESAENLASKPAARNLPGYKTTHSLLKTARL